MSETINVEPSWNDIANIALLLLENPVNERAMKNGREIIKDMGKRLAEVRAQQSDCPEHLKEEESNHGA